MKNEDILKPIFYGLTILIAIPLAAYFFSLRNIAVSDAGAYVKVFTILITLAIYFLVRLINSTVKLMSKKRRK